MPYRALLSLAAALALTLAALSVPASAQGLFAPAVTVNDKVITGYELQQRERFLTLLRAPGNARQKAREQLIEERLKLGAAERLGITVSDTELADGMAEFAARANLETDEFVRALAQGGVAEESFRDFVLAGLAWRQVVRQRFGNRAQVADAEVDRALAGGNGTANVRVLLSEIIMPAPPRQLETVRARAERIAEIRSEAAFSREARRYSATASRGAGGRLPWQNLADLPPGLAPLIVGLAPGEVTDPIPLPNAYALFQLRAIEETGFTPPPVAAIEYATYLIPGGRSADALAQGERIAGTTDRCDDLYGVAKGQPAERLARETKKPAEIPTDIALELSKLDPGEVSLALTRATADGQAALMLVMLCGRTAEASVDASREEVTVGLRNRRLESLAAGFLAELEADARIVEK